MDACWAVKSWGSGHTTPLDVLAERESIYRLLGQTTPENLQRDTASYTLDPHTRYPNLNIRSVLPIQVRGLYNSDDPTSIEQSLVSSNAQELPKKRRRKGEIQFFLYSYSPMYIIILHKWWNNYIKIIYLILERLVITKKPASSNNNRGVAFILFLSVAHENEAIIS